MRFKYPFLEVLADIQPLTDKVVLVGGWAPTVYFEYLWKNTSTPFLTEDIDFGLTKDMTVARPLEEQFDFLQKYRHKHLHLGKEKPYQLMLGDIPIDFLADKTSHDIITKKILGRGIILNVSQDYNFILNDSIVVRCEKLNVRVPHPARYILHKISVYLQNQKTRTHDSAIAYYTLSRSPFQNDILAEIKKLRKTPTGRLVQRELPKLCVNKNSPACLDIQKLFLEVGIRELPDTLFRGMQKIFT